MNFLPSMAPLSGRKSGSGRDKVCRQNQGWFWHDTAVPAGTALASLAGTDGCHSGEENKQHILWEIREPCS